MNSALPGAAAEGPTTVSMVAMTYEQVIDAALSAVEVSPGDFAVVRRNGRPFLALPAGRVAAIHTLRLYQPQRRKARVGTSLTQFLVLAGLHRWLLPKVRCHGGVVALEPESPRCLTGTAGVMLGSPEHRVRRAILCYETTTGREVAKLAFGAEGQAAIDGEARVLHDLGSSTPGVPELLGAHHGEAFSILRLPWLRGRVLRPRDAAAAITLLDQWISTDAPQPADQFPEWPAIEAALGHSEAGRRAADALRRHALRPCVRHGDFARWNLLRMGDGRLMALDWEWGCPRGMAGLDLVHFFAQDARLVQRLNPPEVIRSVEQSFRAPACRRHLDRAGWQGDTRSAVTAGIALTVGARQQANEEVLAALLANSVFVRQSCA